MCLALNWYCKHEMTDLGWNKGWQSQEKNECVCVFIYFLFMCDLFKCDYLLIKLILLF